MNFFILGRPRSRTAWVANFLTTEKSLCLHEGLGECGGDVMALKHDFDSVDHHYSRIGTADTGLIHYTKEIIRTFPDAKFVVLEGTSLSWAFFAKDNEVPDSIYDKVNDDYTETRELLKGKAMFIDANELMTNPLIAALLYTHCTGQPLMDIARWTVLKDLNIQVIPERLKARVASK